MVYNKMTETLGRALLQAAELANPAADSDLPDCAQPNSDQAAHRTLRIGGLFIILAVTICGLGIPLIGRKFSNAFFLARTFGAGVVIATALVHILKDAYEDLISPCLGWSTSYPWAMAIATAAALLTFMAEYYIGVVLRSRFGEGHTHGVPQRCGTDLDAAKVEDPAVADTIAAEKAAARQQLDATVAAYTLEAGVILHSIFVGISYGAETNLGTIRALTIALGFHQGIEGISLGCTFVDASFSKLKYCLFAAAFVFTTPIGISIGLGVGNSYHEGSKAALGIQGTLNAVSAGILLYNGLVDLIIPAFHGHGHGHGSVHLAPKRSHLVTVIGFLSLFAGASLQALLGKWA